MTRLEELQQMADRASSPFIAIKPQTIKDLVMWIEEFRYITIHNITNSPIAAGGTLILDFDKWNKIEDPK